MFLVGDKPVALRIQEGGGAIGLWDNRVFKGAVPKLSYNVSNELDHIDAGFIKRDPLAWFCSHRHDTNGQDLIYQYSYLFKYRLDVPSGAKTLTLPKNPNIR